MFWARGKRRDREGTKYGMVKCGKVRAWRRGGGWRSRGGEWLGEKWGGGEGSWGREGRKMGWEDWGWGRGVVEV